MTTSAAKQQKATGSSVVNFVVGLAIVLVLAIL